MVTRGRHGFLAWGLGLVGLLVAAPTAEAAPAFHKKITINPGQVTGGPLTNFPFLFSTTDPALRTTANGGSVTNANGWDIIFATSPNCADSTSCGGNKLDHEIESYNAVTGQLIAWVRVPSINDGTVLYVHYGDSCRRGLHGEPTRGVEQRLQRGLASQGDPARRGDRQHRRTPTTAPPRSHRSRPRGRSTAACSSTARSTAT